MRKCQWLGWLLVVGMLIMHLHQSTDVARAASGDCVTTSTEVICTYTYTGNLQQWTVPAGILSATFDVYGAQGGSNGGLGGRARATLPVTAGTVYQLLVGGLGCDGSVDPFNGERVYPVLGQCGTGSQGDGGFGGGGQGGPGPSASIPCPPCILAVDDGGGGGGASDVRIGNFSLTERIIVAGGGGGGSTRMSGGGGGGAVGANGGGISPGIGGGGGTATSGGSASGTLGSGGNATAGLFTAGDVNPGDGVHKGVDGPGGGGGGYWGGGAGSAIGDGASAGGGGGSGYGPAGVFFQSGVQAGNGQIIISHPLPDITPPTLLSIRRLDASPTNRTAIHYRITFSEEVTGVDVGDLALTTSGLTGATIALISGHGVGVIVDVEINPGSGSGPLRLDRRGDSTIRDRANNPLVGAFTGSEVYIVDRIPPTAAPTQAPAPNAAGWNNSDVTITWKWSDNPGGVGIDNCRVNSPGAGFEGVALLRDDCRDKLGNGTQATYTVKLDRTKPTITVSATNADGTPYSAGAVTNQAVTVKFICNDTVSGVATCPASQTFSDVGLRPAVSGTALDVAGNSASISFGPIQINQVVQVAAAKAMASEATVADAPVSTAALAVTTTLPVSVITPVTVTAPAEVAPVTTTLPVSVAVDTAALPASAAPVSDTAASPAPVVTDALTVTSTAPLSNTVTDAPATVVTTTQTVENPPSGGDMGAAPAPADPAAAPVEGAGKSQNFFLPIVINLAGAAFGGNGGRALLLLLLVGLMLTGTILYRKRRPGQR